MPKTRAEQQATRDQRAALRAAVLRIWNDPIAFGEALGYQGEKFTGRKRFGDFHRRMLDHAESGPRTSTIVPRGHAKSTLLSVICNAHSLLRNPEGRILLASASLDLGCKLIGEMRDRLRGDIEILPGMVYRVSDLFPWLAIEGDHRRSGPTEAFNIVGRAGTGREPSVFAASVKSSLAGNHPTRAVIDDPVNEQNSRTAARRAQTIEFIEQLEPLMYSPDSPIRHIGTPWAFQDVTAYLERREDWTQFRFGVWDGTNPVNGRQDGAGPGPEGAWPLCPAFLNAEEIVAKEAGVSKTFFASQYLCRPVPSEEALFEPDLLAAATDADFTLEKLPKGPELLLFDPVARLDGVDGDRNAIVIVRVLPAGLLGLKGFERDTNIFFPVRAVEVPGGADAAACWIESVGVPEHRELLKAIWIEKVASQTLFGPWLEERGRIQGVRIRGQKIGNSSLPYRLMALQTALRKGYMILPPAFPGRDLLVQRLLEFPLSDSDDLVSALALLSTMVERRGELPGLPAQPAGRDPLKAWSTRPDGNYWPNG